MTDENAYSNPFCDKDEFEKAFLASKEFDRIRDFLVSVAYASIQAQPVSNLAEGIHLITAIVRIRTGEKDGLESFRFALITENGHVAQP